MTQPITLRSRRPLVRQAWFRHTVVALFSAILVGAFALGREGMHPVHLWNRAFADTSVVLLSLTLVVGPLARFMPRLATLLPWRRELGVWCAVTALVHVTIYLQVLHWDVLRFFMRENDYGTMMWLKNAFGVANWIGVVALLYLSVLALTSNDRSIRLLGRGWKFLQQQSYTLFALVVLHVGVFFYLVYEPKGQLGWVAVVLWSTFLPVVLLQWSAYVRTVRRQAGR